MLAKKMYRAFLVGLSVIPFACAYNAHAEALAALRVYTHLMDAREHPDYDRHFVKPPTWETFGNRTQFATLRGFQIEKDLAINFAEDLDKYSKTFDLGTVIWPCYTIAFAKNADAVADAIKERGLFLFDIWGYVPGSGDGGFWSQYHPPSATLDAFEKKLGDHWLGMDIGEQDGRYIGGYANQMYPISNNRFEQYLNFQRHFEHMGNELGNKLSVLVSLNYGHYLLREGTYASIGAETAQGLPNGQVYYAFIRGAGKQYGVPWFGNASVFNRWGYKAYGAPGPDHSPTKGSSLNLLKRLLYSHILYNSLFAGFESGWFDGEQLSPIGRIQQGANRWVREQGQPGAMLTPVALLLDAYSGWTFPRHLYTGHTYRVWGNLPYERADYFTDAVIDMLYPGYQDASYFHSESGFIAPTPYGDIADVLLSDAPAWLLARYPVIVVAGGLREGDLELQDKLAAYVRQGGCLAMSEANAARLPGRKDKRNFVVLGKGDAMVPAPDPAAPIASETDKPLPKPFTLDADARATLDAIFHRCAPFEAGEGLSLITCRKGPGDYTLGLCNNGLQPKPYTLVSRCGPIASVSELPIDESEKGAVGYLPEGFENAEIGVTQIDGATGVIAGGDVRLLSVKLSEETAQEIPHVAPPARPHNRMLSLRGYRPIKEEVLARPTFFQHFDGVIVDWKYLHEREKAVLQQEQGWLARQSVNLSVDLSSGVNLYPDLRMLDNSATDYPASMAVIDDVLEKMPILGAKSLIVSLHRVPENNITAAETWKSFEETLKNVAAHAATRSITVQLRLGLKSDQGVEGTLAMLNRIAAPNLRIAADVAWLLRSERDADSLPPALKERIGLWLLAAPTRDASGAWTDVRGPLATFGDESRIQKYAAFAPDAPLAFDAVYADYNEEYRDLQIVESWR